MLDEADRLLHMGFKDRCCLLLLLFTVVVIVVVVVVVVFVVVVVVVVVVVGGITFFQHFQRPIGFESIKTIKNQFYKVVSDVIKLIVDVESLKFF